MSVKIEILLKKIVNYSTNKVRKVENNSLTQTQQNDEMKKTELEALEEELLNFLLGCLKIRQDE